MSSGVSFLAVDVAAWVVRANSGSTGPNAPSFIVPLLTSMMCDIGLRRVSSMMDRLLAAAMCGVGGMRYASERPVHHALRLSCNGRLLVDGSRQYAEKTA